LRELRNNSYQALGQKIAFKSWGPGKRLPSKVGGLENLQFRRGGGGNEVPSYFSRIIYLF